MEASPPERWRFETLTRERAVLGESPQWSPGENCIWWVDVTGRKLFRSEAESGSTGTWTTPEEIGFVVLARGGGIVLGMESGLFVFDSATGGFTLIWRLDAGNARFNDASTDGAGRLWATTCDIDNRQALGSLLRIDPDLSVRRVAGGLLTPNGLAADSAGGWLYLSDAHPSVQRLWRLPLDGASGTVGERQEVARFEELPGRPDGATIDAEGTYWIAGVDGATLHGFSPAGRRVAAIETPMACPTKFVFGGPGLDRVYLTSKTGDPGNGGCLAQARPGLRGRRETPFGYGPG